MTELNFFLFFILFYFTFLSKNKHKIYKTDKTKGLCTLTAADIFYRRAIFYESEISN